MFKKRALELIGPDRALAGRSTPMQGLGDHAVLGGHLEGSWKGSKSVLFGMGCFWGAERKFWSLPGVLSTAVGYAGGHTPNPTYEEVCSGMTAHAEVVRVVYDPKRIGLAELLATFWENHDPTQGMRQGNDLGTQYRSAVYVDDDTDRELAERSRDAYAGKLAERGHGAITTEIATHQHFYFAEAYHQQYLEKNPDGYCGLGGTGIACPVGLFVDAG